MTLFVNACVRRKSRTERLARALLGTFDDKIEEVKLNELRFPQTDEGLLRERDRLISAGRFGAPMFVLARQFAKADTIVIAAPYWDLSFPAALKEYFEHINVIGVTFTYTEDGVPQGLCQAKKLYYVTTSGGTDVPDEFGYGYVKALCEKFYGIKDTTLIKAEGLDIVGNNAEEIIEEKIRQIKS